MPSCAKRTEPTFGASKKKGRREDMRAIRRLLKVVCIVVLCGVTNNSARAEEPQKGSVPIEGTGFTLAVTEGGALQLTREGRTYTVESAFSHPGDKIGFNNLSAKPGANQDASWTPAVRTAGDGKFVVATRCGAYELERTVALDGDKVRVSDRIVNVSKEPLGIIVEYALTGSQPFNERLLGGAPVASAPERSENPTVLVRDANACLGMVFEDNLFRVQLSMQSQPDRVTVKDEHFGLAEGQSYAIEWTLYPFDGTGDYWKFINRVRRDWGLHQTIQGPWDFLDAQIRIPLLSDPVALRAYLKRKNLKVVALSPWIDFENLNRITGKLVTRDEYKAMIQRAAAALRAADPNILVTGCVESFPIALSLESTKTLYDRLPPEQKKQGYYSLSPKLFEGIPEINDRVLESVYANPEGKCLVELYFRAMLKPDGNLDYDRMVPLSALMAYPADGNAQQETLLAQAKYLIEDLGLDGLYMDTFIAGGDGYPGYMKYDYKRWDGHSVDIDSKTGRVASRYTDAGFAGASARVEVINYVLKHGKVFVVNGYSIAKEERALGTLRFCESEWCFDPLKLGKGEEPAIFYRLCGGHLSTPIGLGYQPDRTKEGEANYARVITKALITHLRHGSVMYHYGAEIPTEGPASGEYGPFNHMFPITPIELHEGYVVGEERTVTAVSGTFNWPHEREPKVLVFDVTGRPTQGKTEITREKDGWSVKLKIENWENVAVIE
jgi:hypothetical protein